MDIVLQEKALALGAYKAGIVEVKKIKLDAAFRKMCESNACGNYGRNYKCPPDIGAIEDLIEVIKSYDKAIVYQTVGELEDSYDFEGMMDTAKKHNDMAEKLQDYTDELKLEKVLHLSAGGCHLCEICGKIKGIPCAHPDRAMSSLEGYGVNVSQLAELSGMKYINGQNTVTYFGAIFI